MNATEIHSENSTCSQSKQSQWFDDFISALRVDQLKLETGVASKEEKRFFDSLINEDFSEVFKLITSKMHKSITQEVIISYLSELINNRSKTPNIIAFDHLDKEIHVWAEIEDDDEEMENAIYLAEAKTLYAFSEIGYRISTTVVEKSDNLSIPIQYTKVTL